MQSETKASQARKEHDFMEKQAMAQSVDKNRVADLIIEAVEHNFRDSGHKNKTYRNCIEKLVKCSKSAIINGNMFSAFSEYFIRYLSIAAARGDNIIFVCNTDAEIELTYDFLVRKFSEITSLHCNDSTGEINFDDPIWKIIKIKGNGDNSEEASVDEKSILVTSLRYLSSSRFENDHKRFIHLIDTVVFIDTLETINKYNRQMAMFSTRVKHIAETNECLARNGGRNEGFRLRYMARPIKYICFDDSRTPGLDKVLKNLTAEEFESLDAMQYNPNAVVRCYNYDGRKDVGGRVVVQQFVNTREELGPMMNVALMCLKAGAKSVTVFADKDIPYENIKESIAANAGSMEIGEKQFRLNRAECDASDYSVIIAMDSEENLPRTLRKYVSLTASEKTLIIIFSKPYMLRDFYYANIDEIWSRIQLARIPVETGTKKDFAQKLLIRASSGGMIVDEIFRSALNVSTNDYREMVNRQDVISILADVLDIYGVLNVDKKADNEKAKLRYREQVLKIFEFRHDCVFGYDGKFCSEDRVFLRPGGELYDLINGRDMASLILDGSDKTETIPLPRARITQNYIAGQNLIFNGNIYTIRNIDTEKGILYVQLAFGGINTEVHQYIQNREYIVHPDDESPVVLANNVIVLKGTNGGIAVEKACISVFRASTEVITHGYYEVSSRTFAQNNNNQNYHKIDGEDDSLAQRSYRRYGKVVNPYYESKPAVAGNKGALMMTIRLNGKLGEKTERTVHLAAAMIREIIRSMFPSVADSVAVCASQQTEACSKVDIGRPKLTVKGKNNIFNKDVFEITIIEDSVTELGVISALSASGEDTLKTLFTPIDEYLEWYLKSEKKSNYLYYGSDREPAEFDFVSLSKLAALLADRDHELRFGRLHERITNRNCDFCGRRVRKNERLDRLSDGRKICDQCKKQIVTGNKRELKEHTAAAKLFLESNYGIKIDNEYAVCFDSAERILQEIKAKGDTEYKGDIPLFSFFEKRRVHVEKGLPSANLTELFVRELTHAWQRKNVPDLSADLSEGLLAIVDIQYLRFISRNGLADERTSKLNSSYTRAGTGYREIAGKLKENPKYRNNPFLYLLATASGEFLDELIPEKPRKREMGEDIFGKKYEPKEFDRVLEGPPEYFYRNRLASAQQMLYDSMVEAIIQHVESVDANGLKEGSVFTVSKAISYDRPDLFWYNNCTYTEDKILLKYGIDREEREKLQKQMDEMIPKFVEDIDDKMSAYDAAIRIYAKVVNATDYDTIALNEQKAKGGPAKDEIDYLRTICGVFIRGTAVCEGYARAIAYLMQKCGIECAEAAGYITKADGGQGTPHAWNIIKIDGEYYHVDATWDDYSNTNQAVKHDEFGYNYFCITTEEIQRTRKVDLCPTDVPICSAVGANYYYHNSLILTKYDLNEIKRFAAEAAERGLDKFSFKCGSIAVYREAINRLFVSSSEGFSAVGAAAKANRKIDGSTYSYSWDAEIRTITIKFKFKNR